MHNICVRVCLLFRSCTNGFSGTQCENHACQSVQCQNQGQCQIENRQAVCR